MLTAAESYDQACELNFGFEGYVCDNGAEVGEPLLIGVPIGWLAGCPLNLPLLPHLQRTNYIQKLGSLSLSLSLSLSDIFITE